VLDIARLPVEWRGGEHAVTVLFAPGLAHVATDDDPACLMGQGDMLVVAPLGRIWHVAGIADGWTRLSASRRFLSTVLPARTTMIVPCSTVTEALRRHLALLAPLLSLPLDPVPAHFIAASVRELLGATTASVTAPVPRVVRRDEDMFDRITAYIDAHLAQDIDVADLCHALGYSRSALYRATASAGGLVEMTMQRRLEAIYRTLQRGDDGRSIAAVARAHGFADASQFSRRFRRAFGVSAGQVRAVSA
jgi:AraC-like DNA-binding protein